MLKRKVFQKLLGWKNSGGKKTCLLLYGVRQCGKTFIVRQFASENYESVIELNFALQPGLRQIFSGDLDVETLKTNITLSLPGSRFIEGKTLLFFDEIQDCPEARTSLKSWAEDGRYDVIASGSMLGIRYKEMSSIPVGYETPVEMYPLDFEEFLWAQGIEAQIIEKVRAYSDGSEKVPEAINKSMLQRLREYLIVGGMPDAVNAFIQGHDYELVQNIQDRILLDYQDDIAKYASAGDRIKARSCFLSIPKQLAKENHKFKYSVVEHGGTARKFESSIDWLVQAGMVRRACNVTMIGFPLLAYEKEEQFRTYLCDIGLLCAMYGYQVKAAVLSDSLEGPLKGALYESLIADILYKRGETLRYYKKEDSTLELEFLLERNASTVPVEVKAKHGATRSMNEVLKQQSIPYGIKLTSQNAGIEGKKLTLPLYLAQWI